jgi:hypothetical protein
MFIEFDAVDVQRNETYHPVDHLAWINSKRSEETDKAITKDSCREGCKYGSGGANFRVIKKLKQRRVRS